MLNAAKDALTSRAAMAWANSLIGRYGRVQALKIDSRRKTIEVACELQGESSPISIRVDEYAIESDSDSTYISLRKFTASRPWLQNFLNDFGHRQKIRLPPWAAGAL
ncbi:MAG TPA: hypothetical protein VHD32_00260 [Candidatus Didemnitutus sp.]|nr:hypothetical protein [Candidatus Didemnitutus sp.]